MRVEAESARASRLATVIVPEGRLRGRGEDRIAKADNVASLRRISLVSQARQLRVVQIRRLVAVGLREYLENVGPVKSELLRSPRQ
jgi:hypothetical protein